MRHLAIADGKRCWRWAQSRIEGESLVVWHPDLSCPAAVRYAWADNPEGCNLVNGAGLPASPFDSDDLQRRCANADAGCAQVRSNTVRSHASRQSTRGLPSSRQASGSQA